MIHSNQIVSKENQFRMGSIDPLIKGCIALLDRDAPNSISWCRVTSENADQFRIVEVVRVDAAKTAAKEWAAL